MIIKRIEPISAVRIFGLFNASVGLVMGLIFAGMSLFGYTIEAETGDVPLSKGFGLLSVIALPLMYGAAGAFSGFVCSHLYNFIASRFGGLTIDTE